MTKIQIALTGLVAGTSVSGGTHFIQNVQSSSRRFTESIQKGKEQPAQKQDVGGQQAETVSGTPKITAEVIPGNENSADESLVETAEKKEELRESSDVGPKLPGASQRVQVDDTRGPVQDILGESAISPINPGKQEKYRKGTPDLPDIICVAEDTGEKIHKWNGPISQYSPACIRKKSVSDYELARTAQFCELDVMDNLRSELSETLQHKPNKRCKYWDSWNGPKTNLRIEEVQTPVEFRESANKT
ncbi:hypothetical protein MHLP_01740 [Candidatus Mycoplasma haematolamae str. Purdue]|uniref:Uncharacterized protein n=1 Tax=Mycoplasma haematolamae (strain Purdue) TaxID=1212765 RepID=I7BJB4_MYCHA|nr:hypothetical protein [Candidatus Mycoplasma haematolamae]AFO51928.1 hypothetical protein MHLP_01740 [Candidatus Mycoplasma haematolamae str. Purdue]